MPTIAPIVIVITTFVVPIMEENPKAWLAPTQTPMPKLSARPVTVRIIVQLIVINTWIILIKTEFQPNRLQTLVDRNSAPESFNNVWYTDSGAHSHISADLANLSLNNEYHGDDQLAVGNGAGLKISHVGSSQLLTEISTFHLNDILHCPNGSANLLSVNKFTHDKNFHFIFSPNGFCVKDNVTGKMLFGGRYENGLYPFLFTNTSEIKTYSRVLYLENVCLPRSGTNDLDNIVLPC